MMEDGPSYDIGQLRSLYRAYDINGECLAESEFLSDSDALAWGNYLNESHDEEFYVIAHRQTAGRGDTEIGRWGVSQVYDADPKTHKITLRPDTAEPSQE